MATTVDDVKEVAKEFEAKFTEFKSANDKRIEAIEAEKAKLVEKVDGYDEKLASLEKRLCCINRESYFILLL